MLDVVYECVSTCRVPLSYVVAAALMLIPVTSLASSAAEVPMPLRQGSGVPDAGVNETTPTATTRFLVNLSRPGKAWTRTELAARLLEGCRNVKWPASRSEVATLVDMLQEDGLLRSDGSLNPQLQLREVALACIQEMPSARPYVYTRREGVTPVREILSITVSGDVVRFHVTALDANDSAAAQAGARAWESRAVAGIVPSAPPDESGSTAIVPDVDQVVRACAPRPGQTCFTVRGRLYIANGGTWRRLWVAGTKRILGVHDDYELPENVDERLRVDADHPFGKPVFGSFTFCPFKPDKPGVMRIGCVQAGENLRTE